MMITYLHGRVGGTKKALDLAPGVLRERILTDLSTVRAEVDFLKQWLPVIRDKVQKSVFAAIAGRAKVKGGFPPFSNPEGVANRHVM